MRNQNEWRPGKFVFRSGRLRGSRNSRELGVGSRLVADLVAQLYEEQLPVHAVGRLLDLGCGRAPLYEAYRPHVSSVICADWTAGEHVDLRCDLSCFLPFADERFDTIVLSDVLEHVPNPELLWTEMARVLAPAGKILMNVPFYYAVHEHPHDYYRYTNFALQRFVSMSQLHLLEIRTTGGLVEVVADLFAKVLARLPFAGVGLSSFLQWLVWHCGQSRVGSRIANSSSRAFPLGYFLVAQKKG